MSKEQGCRCRLKEMIGGPCQARQMEQILADSSPSLHLGHRLLQTAADRCCGLRAFPKDVIRQAACGAGSPNHGLQPLLTPQLAPPGAGRRAYKEAGGGTGRSAHSGASAPTAPR
ncbi:hypothetical protein CapIbe_019227 [Capra ibex]